LAQTRILTAIVWIYFYPKVVVSLHMRPEEGKVAVPGLHLRNCIAGGLPCLYHYDGGKRYIRKYGPSQG